MDLGFAEAVGDQATQEIARDQATKAGSFRDSIDGPSPSKSCNMSGGGGKDSNALFMESRLLTAPPLLASWCRVVNFSPPHLATHQAAEYIAHKEGLPIKEASQLKSVGAENQKPAGPHDFTTVNIKPDG